MKREHWLYLSAAGCGAAIWILIALASGRNEAWDSGLYFSVGIPAVCLVSMAFAFFEPNRSLTWGVLPLVGQFVWMLLSSGPGNILPFGVIVFGVLSVPPIIAARIVRSSPRRRLDETNLNRALNWSASVARGYPQHFAPRRPTRQR
jgi:hypothetical protein